MNLATALNTATVASSIAEANPTDNTAGVTMAVAEMPIVVSSPISVSGKNQSNIKAATFTHANGVEPASAFIATINWGDGSTSTGSITQSGSTYTVKGSHTYSQNGSHTVTTSVVEASSGPAPAASVSDLYVWSIAGEDRTRGGKHDAQVNVVIRRDSNADGAPGAADAVVANARVTLQLFTSTGALVGTASGNTDSKGLFSSDWFKNLAAGEYFAEVLAVEKDGLQWNNSLDSNANVSDRDGDTLPDQQFTVAGNTAPAATISPAISAVKLNSPSTSPSAPSVQSLTASLPREAIDQVLSQTAFNRSRHAHRAAVSHALIDEIFGLGRA